MLSRVVVDTRCAGPIHGPRTQIKSLRATRCREADLAGRRTTAPDFDPGLSCFNGRQLLGGALRPALGARARIALLDTRLEVGQRPTQELQRVAGQRVGL